MSAVFDVRYGSIIEEITKRKTVYKAYLYLETEADKLAYHLPYGSNPKWNTRSLPIKVTVSRCESYQGKDCAPYLLYQEAEYGLDSTGIGVPLVQQYDFKYGTVSWPLKMEWYGIRIATRDDCTEGSDKKLTGKVKSFQTNDFCTPGNMLYWNASDASAGAEKYSSNSDFAEGKQPDPSLIGNLILDKFWLYFYTKSSPHSIEKIKNKTNGSFSSRYKPDDVGVRKWLCYEEEIERIVSGTERITRVTRSFAKVPAECQWNADKYQAWTSWV